VNWKNFFLAGLAGGAAMALLSNLPVLSLGNCLLCGWLWGGGMLAAWLYRRWQGVLTLSEGGFVGLLAGFTGGLLSAFWTVSGAEALRIVPGEVTSLLPGSLQSQIEMLSMMGELIVSLAVLELLGFTILGAVGGLVAGAIWREKRQALDEQAISLVGLPSRPDLPLQTTTSFSLPADGLAPPQEPPPDPPTRRTFIPPPQPRPLEGKPEVPPEEWFPPDD
jgi:hypothetical protein